MRAPLTVRAARTPSCAFAVVPVEDKTQDGVVMAEMEPAYRVGERVVRPAKVKVGRAADRSPV